jgi:hypothetical protein
MSSPHPSKSAATFAGFINFVLALTQIGIVIVLGLMLKEVHLIFKELEKVITGNNYINVDQRGSSKWVVEVSQ